MNTTRKIWLIYAEHGKCDSDSTFSPLSVSDTEEEAMAATEAFARAYAEKHSYQVDVEDGVWVVWTKHCGLAASGAYRFERRREKGRFFCREVQMECLTPEERRKILNW